MTEEGSGSIKADVKVTHDTPDLEAGGNSQNVNPLQALQQHSAKFHEETVRPLLEKAGASFKMAHEQTVAKTKEITDATVQKSKELTEATVQKSKEFHAATMQKSKELTEATVQKSRELGTATVNGTRSLGIGTSIAAAATVAHTKHTLSQIGSEPTELDPETGEVKIKGEENDHFITNIFARGFIPGIAICGGIAALVSFVLLSGHLIDLASLGTMVLAPLVFWQKMQLNALGGMRTQQNRLRASVNRLTTENSRLSEANTQLETQVDGLKDVETKLNDVAIESGAQVDRLVNVVHENGELQKKIKELLENQVVQQIMTAIINEDRDGSFTLDHREVRRLEIRLDAIPAVHFDPKNFRNFLASDQDDLTLQDLTHLIQNLKDDSVPQEKKIFTFKPTDILEEVPPPETV